MVVDNIRHFNRFYTRTLGVFNSHVFRLNYSLLEMRTLGEIYRHVGVTSNKLTSLLNIDKTSLSRIIRKLESAQLIYREQDAKDGRSFHFFLSEEGSNLNDYVEKQSDEKIVNVIDSLSNDDIHKLEQSMIEIERIFKKVRSNK
ncbi:MarR family winged helix-turn-helix transcriptional regulator [Leuconostoc falkenbergense]